ncbi:hypothetical protein BN1723_009920 [Verticillium longisporum]|uniref:Serine-threonine protein kinase 19 n=2 Tax=Verticillium longisporum TaxID=100787 RepID=A0A0G4M710_VERLO|nr:hypothetical protein BN1723_009920 [Verticillium longisporum]CRK30034.1 hypothetical protein BN1708_018400 [Verticillium longisporum]
MTANRQSRLAGGRITKPSPSSSSSSLPSSKKTPARSPQPKKPPPSDYEEDYFQDHLDDQGLVLALATDLTLRDVPQAMARARSTMFGPVPGMGSKRMAKTVNFHAGLPGFVSAGHVHAVLGGSPTSVEREVATLEGRGVLRRLRVRGRGEVLIRQDEYEGLVRRSSRLDEDTKGLYLKFLGENPRAGIMSVDTCDEKQGDALVRAGFLTGGTTTRDENASLGGFYGRPEDKTSLASIAAASRAASGSIGAVGGIGALQNAGGSSGASRLGRGGISPEPEYRIAAPGHGSYLKLVSAAVEHLMSLLSRSKYGEMPEYLLRERWDGGIASDDARKMRRARGEFTGVLPWQTKKWREFYGLEFGWVLAEAMGTGRLEVFETGSVGRGVRKLRDD